MFASLVAALACAAPAANASALDVHAISLPPEAAMSAPAARDELAAGDRVLASFADDLESRSPLAFSDEHQLFTPLDVDCYRTHAPAVDWSALASHGDTAGVCRQLGVSRSGSIAAALARARTRGGAHVDGEHLVAGAPDFVPDGHATPPLRPARLALVHVPDGAPAWMPAAVAPPAAPGRRIDRPPRS